jgi:hypothetical protein
MPNPTGKGGFQKGNAGNPNATGRPRRQVERDYLRATLGAVPLKRWVKVVRQALDQAEQGDPKAREWLGKMLLGSDPLALQQLVAELQQELRRVKSHAQPQRNGEAVADRIPGASAEPGAGE